MYARRSKLVTVSEFSRAELSSILRVDPRDIIVAGNGAEHMRWLKPDSAILQKLGVEGRKYFLTVGTRSPVKNLEVVVKAVVKSKIDDVLVIVAGSSDGRVFGETIVPNDSRLLLAGRVRDEELLALYQNSEALIFSSHYEGFGIPPLEAMSSGCPVIASDIATLREVCRGAVLYFDPKEPRSLIAAMKSILEENELKSKMIVQGRKHAEIYKWDKTADLILNAAVELAKF
jgi:glycosyltransferase involved in cell wall biosynthesis